MIALFWPSKLQLHLSYLYFLLSGTFAMENVECADVSVQELSFLTPMALNHHYIYKKRFNNYYSILHTFFTFM